MEVELFGHKLTLKDNSCALNGAQGKKITQPYINMYVTMTNQCPAKCKFCCNEAHSHDVVNFDFFKFFYLIHEIQNYLTINKLSFTGGEPSLNMDLLTKCVTAVKENNSEIFTIINTNGIHLKELDAIAPYFDSIALSRHYFEDSVNNEIFGLDTVAQSKDIIDFKNKDILHLSCNFQKGYIDSAEKVQKYLESAAALGCGDVGFVSLMPANDFCTSHFVDFKDIDFDSINNLFISKEWNNGCHCRCRNYLYIPQDIKSVVDIVKMYARYYVDNTYCISTLVYDGQNLRAGFGGKIIF